MVEITRERMELLYKAQKNSFSCTIVICIIGTFISTILYVIGEDMQGSYRSVILLISFAFFIIPIIYTVISFKKFIPPGNGKIVRAAFQNMRYDFLSDKTVNMLFESIGKAANYADKTMLTLYLCDVYLFRGQINEAISLINSIDRSMFVHYPTIGMTFYEEVMSIYSVIEDNNSVIAAFADGEKFIDECAFRNYLCCSKAVGGLIMYEEARGNYRSALQLLLMRNEFENNIERDNRNSGSVLNHPLAQFSRGIVFINTAELYYLCGDLWEAGQSLDIGGPMVASCPFMLNRANTLSAKIRQAKAEQYNNVNRSETQGQQ
ncbi:MAG: hypothetical protein K2K57_11690 [Oscillospiraceae bacterium]|nr:hypothetical protein [Oscillospiraceae bacterium]